jgi:hypothetical protein
MVPSAGSRLALLEGVTLARDDADQLAANEFAG